MRIAVIADVHSNMYALERVAESIDRLDPDQVWCAGDIVGYNAQPKPVIAWMRERVDIAVAGNHDVDVATCSTDATTRSDARWAQQWTCKQIDDSEREYLAKLPNHHASDGLELAHGCYLNKTYFSGYVTPTMLRANLDALALRVRGDGPNVGICGHTHLPMIGWLQADSVISADPSSRHVWPEGADAVIINPGAVGQPRDRDPRASFAIIDTAARSVEIHRCQYDVAAARSAIESAGLPQDLADRLAEGR